MCNVYFTKDGIAVICQNDASHGVQKHLEHGTRTKGSAHNIRNSLSVSGTVMIIRIPGAHHLICVMIVLSFVSLHLQKDYTLHIRFVTEKMFKPVQLRYCQVAPLRRSHALYFGLCVSVEIKVLERRHTCPRNFSKFVVQHLLITMTGAPPPSILQGH